MYLFGLIGLITGFIIGISIMKIKIQKSLQKKIFQNNTLENKINKINELQKEIENSFNQNTHLLNKIIKNHQELYQNMIKSSILYDIDHTHSTKKKLFQKTNIKNHKNLKHIDLINKQLPTKEPRDYPESNHNK